MFYQKTRSRTKQKQPFNTKGWGPIAEVKYKPFHSEEFELVPVHIVRVYQGDWACVRFIQENYHFGKEGYWMVRGGVQWPKYLQRVVQCYKNNQNIPQDFVCSKRLPEKVLDQMEKMSSQHSSQLVEVFQKLRDSDFLPQLTKFTASSCPPVLDWATIKNHYQDFK